MKTYKNFLAFTLSLALIFLTSYLSDVFFKGGLESVSALYATGKPLPSQSLFPILWGIVYLCMVSQMSVTIAYRCLRKAIKIWLLLLFVNVLFTLTYFQLNLTYLGVSLIILSIILLLILTSFYVRNTFYLWLFSIPLLATYGYSLFLAIVTAL